MDTCCLKMPIALLQPVINGSGMLVEIRNISDYNDASDAAFARKAEWYIIQDGQIVHNFPMDYVQVPFGGGIGGNRESMILRQGSKTIFNFLSLTNSNTRLEIACRVINGKRYYSGMSNKVLLSASATWCDGYKLKIGGTLYGAIAPNGDCYVPPINY